MLNERGLSCELAGCCFRGTLRSSYEISDPFRFQAPVQFMSMTPHEFQQRAYFHAGDENGVGDVRRGLDVVEIFESRCGPRCSLDTIVTTALHLGYRWGVSDGN